MKSKLPLRLTAILLLSFLLPVTAYAIPGDADGNGVVDLEDARTIARFLAGQIPAIPNPKDADANQDGKIDMEDAFIISKKVTGQTRIVVVAPLNGSPDVLRLGAIVRIEVFEKFFPFNITGGKVRIQSANTGYDSGDQTLTFERDGRSLYYHWNTAGLTPASDYAISVNLTSRTGSSVMSALSASAGQPDATASLTNEVFKPAFLANVVDAFCPAPGIPLEFRRHVPNNAPAYPYLGPLGRGWFHSYDFKLEDHTDGRIALRNRIFQSNNNGTYQSSPGDYGVLVRNPDATFQLKEKDGTIYRFRSNLYLDYIQDLNGNRISAIYDSSNHLIEIRHSCGKSFFLTYNTAGRISTLTDHAGRVTTYEYGPGSLTLTRVTDPAGNETDYTWVMGAPYILSLRLVCLDVLGNQKPCGPAILDYRLQSIGYPDGTRMQYDYDGQARLVRQAGAWGANPVTYSYDPDGTTHVADALGVSATVRVNDKGQPTLVTAPDGARVTNQYDTSSNLTQTTDPLSHTTQFSYDAFGNVTQISNPLNQTVQFGYDLRFNKPSSITNPLGKTTSFVYDAKGNKTATTYPDSTHESYAYDSLGNLTSVQDAAGMTTSYTYNSQGQMTALKTALGNTTGFSYDTAGDLQNVTDAKEHAVSHTRDALGRLTRRTYPDGSHEDYEYDDAGKVTAFTNRRGERITFSYDVTGRLEWKIYPSGKQLHYFYDAAGYLASVEQVVGGGTTTLDTAYERDALHRITRAKVPGKVYPESYDVSYAYDAAGRRTFMSYPDGYSLNYAYDVANRLTRVSDASDATIVAYQYDAAGRRTRKTLGNGTYATYQYDDLDRLTLLVNNSPSGTVQSRFAYTYNAAGMRTSMTTLEGVNSYTYDSTYQLTHVTYPDGRAVDYAFDKVGNRTTVTDNRVVTSYETNSMNQYLQAGTETFGYDGNGNITIRTLNSTATTYEWDEDDRLVGVDRSNGHIDYRYDHKRRLIAKVIEGQETRYIWDDLDLIAETNSAGQVVKRYIYGATTDEVLLVIAGGNNYWCQQDGLGSVVGTSNDGGAVIAAISYDVYGSVRSGDLEPVQNRLAGMIWDHDSTLNYVRARWYSPTEGRFISPDPIGIVSGDGNYYRYVQNSPNNYVDSYGLASLRRYTGLGWPHYHFFFDNPVHIRVGGKEVTVKDIGFFPHNLIGDWSGDLGYNYDINDYKKVIRNNLDDETLKKAIEDVGLPPDWKPFINDCEDWANKVMKRYDDISRQTQTDNPNNLNTGGGTCPTFIQTSSKVAAQLTHATLVNADELYGKIEIPVTSSLLRSDIPIFGIAGGKKFKSYRVDIGAGADPKNWELVESSSTPRSTNAVGAAQIPYMQGDIDIRGNLATWNTGLKNWSHLPWHPPEDPTDLNGVYTLRLTVFGKDGRQVEDRVTVEVGRVIAQCLPGIAISPDKKVVMHFPEQALTNPFRVFTILPLPDVGEETPAIAKGFELIGQVYRIREAGDRFIKDVSLEFNAGVEEIGNRKPEHIGIGRYDSVKNEWVLLSTIYDRKSFLFSTVLTELPSPKAIYALMHTAESKLSSLAQPPPSLPALLKPVRPGVLVDNTFESDMGTLKPRDRIVGAMLSRDNKATPDGSYCLKFTNENHGGNFSSTLIDQPFDAAEYGTMTFDYRIGLGVKVDFFLKVDGRWYNLRFTGDAVDYRNKDVNIANLGAVEGVLADDKWHTANVDLRYLLHQQTQHTRVDEVIMANWSVGGYMKLEFGSNARGATYYIDNFKLTGPGKVESPPPVLMVDDFNEAQSKNLVGGTSGAYTNPGTRYVESYFVDVPPSSMKSPGTSIDTNRALVLDFDTTMPDSYGGYWTSIVNANLSNYAALSFKLKSAGNIPKVIVGIRNRQGIEGKAAIGPYASKPDAHGWRSVRIPLTGLRGLPDVSSPDVLFFSVTNRDGSDKGSIQIDDLRFEQQPVSRIADFESPYNWTLLGGEITTLQNGAAAISAGNMKEALTDAGTSNTVMRISYGGSIGQDYGLNGGFSYAIWRAGLNGIDARQFSHLVMRIRGERGGEAPNIYLTDPVRRYPLRPDEMPLITREWQTIRLPLEHYAKHGIDLSHLESLETVFEWKEQSGTIYVDDIRFE